VIRDHLNCGNKELPKIGHGGTLDPEATGLLIVGITRAGTKGLTNHIKADKIYECEVDLLKDSKTGDLESFEQKEMPDNTFSPPLAIVEEIIASQFIGEIEQTPPIYSALKICGQKACDLARAGKDVKIEPRRITIYSVEVVAYEFPVLTLRVHCSKGCC
jgi:tRNA pseudouridine55 synthase